MTTDEVSRGLAFVQIGYMTTDEVNRDLVERLAAECGAVAHALSPGEMPRRGAFDAVLFDLDAIPRSQRPALFAEIVSRAGYPRGIHGYDLEEEQARSLRLAGVAVAQRLLPELIQTLCRTVLRKLASVPPDDALMDATWIGVPTPIELQDTQYVSASLATRPRR
jgi:hypothetical protein